MFWSIAGLRERERDFADSPSLMSLIARYLTVFGTSHFAQDQRNASNFLYKLKGIIISLRSGDFIVSNPRIPDFMGLCLV